jgi:capsular polysaccharide transport system permease protein
MAGQQGAGMAAKPGHKPAAKGPDVPSSVEPPAGMFRAGPVDMPAIGSQRLFGRLTLASFVLCVLVPFLAASLYFAFVATDRYAVEVKFAIRSPTGSVSPDLLGLVTGAAASGSTQSDSYMVIDFLESRQFVEEIAKQIDLVAIYSKEGADIFSRLRANPAKEDIVAYLPRRVWTNFDSTSQIISVETQAFTPEDARRMAEGVISVTSDLVNRVSEQARQDTVRLAETEVSRAEEALRAQRAALSSFRETEQKIDPAATVAAQETVLAQLQGDLARNRAELSSLREFLAEDAPSVRVLQSRIDSIERQIGTERGRLGSGDNPVASAGDTAQTQPPDLAGTGTGDSETLTISVSEYEVLKVDLEFRQRAYLSALASLELARVEADRQQRYLAAFVLPSTPEKALYPQAFLLLALIGVVAFLIWGVLVMFANIVREHVH